MEISRRDASIWKYLVEMRLYGNISSRCVYMEIPRRNASRYGKISSRCVYLEISRRYASLWKDIVEMRLYGKISSRCFFDSHHFSLACAPVGLEKPGSGSRFSYFFLMTVYGGDHLYIQGSTFREVAAALHRRSPIAFRPRPNKYRYIHTRVRSV